MTDPLAPLLDLPGVAEAVTTARDSVAEVHRHPTNRRGWPTTAAEASVRAARASAVLDGGRAEIPTEGTVTDPVLAGSLRVAEALGPLLPTWERAPRQALARLHVLAAADLTDQSQLGRPRPDPDITSRLDLLANLVAGGTKAPGPILAAIVHAELLALSPFPTANGVIARAAARLTLISTGLDPKGLTVPEVAYLRQAPRYRTTTAAFATGDPTAIADWITFSCHAITQGAQEATTIATAAIPPQP
ncbi:hypothetical protein [Actinokineospora inagensis]|uniref:hypothetical protein n=1 Tax=Actinokineospora inagensis TaxID=103730 RepID=UPI000428C315|nr:hypothetical protein [Actinokineospora inagensis]